MHIGFLSFESPFASNGCGVASYLRAMIPALISGGHRVTLIVSSAERDDRPMPSYGGALRTVPVHLPNAHWYVSKLPVAGKLLTQPVREMEWSFKFRAAVERAMHRDPMHLLEVTELGTWWLARDPILPLVARLHGAEYTFARHTGQRVNAGSAWTRKLQRHALDNAAVVTSPSRFHAAEVTREMRWQSGHVAVVPNVIASGMLERAQPDARGESSVEPRLILYTGRLAPVKGTPVLLTAAREVLKEFPQAEFVLAGPWQMPFPSNQWERYLERFGAPNQISWVGYRNQEQLAALYRKAAVFVMPSFYETFGISCLEAMAFQVPVVATRAGALPEVVEHERTGLTVAPGDAGALAAAIVRLLRDADLRRSMGAEGRARVYERYTPQAVRDDMISVYQQACGWIQ
jgi:glycosyltransferase involved in cell wall biosynthesis